MIVTIAITNSAARAVTKTAAAMKSSTEGKERGEGKNLIVSLNAGVAYFLLLSARAVAAAPAAAPKAAPIQAARVQVSS